MLLARILAANNQLKNDLSSDAAVAQVRALYRIIATLSITRLQTPRVGIDGDHTLLSRVQRCPTEIIEDERRGI